MANNNIKNEIPPKIIIILLIIVLVAILVVVNMIGILAVDVFSLKYDMTDNRLYGFSQTTYDVADALEDPVTIIVFNNESDFVIMLREIMRRYDALSDKITLKYKDPFENPILVNSYKQKGYDIKQNDIVIEGKNRIKIFEIEDLYTFNTTKTSVTGIRAEQQITSAILYVNDNDVPVVRFTDGHNERPTTALMSLFEQNNYYVSRVTINVMGIEEDTDILVIASPTRDFEKDEIRQLDAFMEDGGRIMVFLEPSVKVFENLNQFLEKWGIRVGDEIIFEEEAFVSGNPINIVPMYLPHEINKYFIDNRYFLVVPSARSLYRIEKHGYDLEVKGLLSSSSSSYGKSIMNLSKTEKEAADIEGPFHLAMTSSKEISKIGDGQSSFARMFVAGSRLIYADDMLGTSSYANADFLVQTINWLGENERSINIPIKSIAHPPIIVLPKQAMLIGIVLLGVIPTSVLLMGIVIYIRRKNL